MSCAPGTFFYLFTLLIIITSIVHVWSMGTYTYGRGNSIHVFLFDVQMEFLSRCHIFRV